jgi:hypothetical protein
LNRRAPTYRLWSIDDRQPGADGQQIRIQRQPSHQRAVHGEQDLQ